jgi:hypothetical protein
MDHEFGLNNAAIRGQICSNMTFDKKDSGMQFSIKTPSGVFFIKTYGLENIRLCEGLKRGQTVNVIGELHSFVSNRCRSNHAYIKALTLVPDEDSPAFRHLVTLLGVQVALNGRPAAGRTGRIASSEEEILE